jgi:peptidoglycan/LPS O-acetylase OafA/YrhL
VTRALQPKPAEVLSVQYLRAAAALLVVFYHARQFPGFEAAVGTSVGKAGVEIFFVISGFVMAVTAGRANTPALRFLEKRILRIVPLYWTMTLLTAGLLLAVPNLFRDNLFTWNHFLLSLLFIPHVNPVDADSYSPLIKIGWTLNFEMFFYFTFAALMRFRLATRIAAMTILFSALIAANRLWQPDLAPLQFWASGELFEFVMGCAIGYLYLNGSLAAVPVPVAWAGIAGSVLTLLIFGSYHPDIPRAVVVGIPAAFLVAAAIGLEQKGRMGISHRWKFLGDASYSLYLTHLLPIVILRKLWALGHLPTQGLGYALIFIALTMSLAILVGATTYRYFEKPLLGYLRRRLGLRRRPAEPIAEPQSMTP